nr:Bdr family repetitive protein [Borrelia sp. BU AG58]
MQAAQASRQKRITEQQMFDELIRIGMDKLFADDLASRYYHNELTYRDLENLEKNFNTTLRALEIRIVGIENRLNEVKDDIKSVKDDIKRLDSKIDSVETRLEAKIESVKKDIRDEFNIKIDGVETRLDAKIDHAKVELKKDIALVKSDLKGSINTLWWMFGTIATFNVGILLTLITIAYSMLRG